MSQSSEGARKIYAMVLDSFDSTHYYSRNYARNEGRKDVIDVLKKLSLVYSVYD
jgi:hypothetical protein